MMQIEKITLGPGGRIPHRFLDELDIKGKEPLTVVHSTMGIIFIRHSKTLTDLLSHLVETKNTKWDESEYSEYLLGRTR